MCRLNDTAAAGYADGAECLSVAAFFNHYLMYVVILSEHPVSALCLLTGPVNESAYPAGLHRQTRHVKAALVFS